MTRIKTKTTTFQSVQEFELAVDKIASLQLKLESQIADFNEKKSTEDKAFKARVKTTKSKINELLVSCESYAAHHRESILGDKQTGETKLAFYGYRKSPGIVKTLNSKWTFAKALETLKKAGKTCCIKVSETLDKNAVKTQIPETEMAAFGLRIDFPEDFGIEAKRAEETPSKKATA